MPLHPVHVGEETSMAAIEARANERADALIGLDKRDRRAAIDATRRGLSIEGLDRLVQTGRLTSAELDRVVLPRKTLSHRRKIGSLPPQQSDRLPRGVPRLPAPPGAVGGP